MELIILLGCVVGVAVLFGVGFTSAGGGEKVALKERLATLSNVPEELKSELGQAKESAIPKIDLKNILSKFTGQAYVEAMEKELAQADIPVRVSEFLMLRMAGVLVGFGLVYLKYGNLYFAMGAGFLMIFAHIPVIKIKRSLRITKFVVQLAEFLLLITNSLKAGQTFLQGVDIACQNSPHPIAYEFKILIKETNLGLPIDDSFNNMLVRVPSEELKIVMSAFSIQRKVGGNLADIMAKVADMIRQRIQIQGQIRVLTTQGKLSGAIVGLLPFGLATVLSFIAPTYMENLYKNVVGWILIAIAVFMQLVGCFVIYKICDIEV